VRGVTATPAALFSDSQIATPSLQAAQSNSVAASIFQADSVDDRKRKSRNLHF
jgi:hypothetical protein